MANETTATEQQKKDLAEAKRLLDSGADIRSLPPKLLKAIETEYQYAVEVILSDKRLMQLFTSAVRNGVTDAAFEQMWKDHPWARERTSSREWYDLRSVDPDYKLELDVFKSDIATQVRNYVVQKLGLDVNSEDVSSKVDAIAQDILENYSQSQMGWQSKIADLVGAKFSNVKASEFGGSIADSIKGVYDAAVSLGLPVSENALDNYVGSIVKGETTLDTITATLRKQAAGIWTQFSDRIMAGESVKNVLYPYTQMVSSMLEIDPEELDFTVDDPTKPASKQIDPLLQSALFSAADGKSVMSLTDLRKAIKKDSRWQYTRNAQEEYSSLTRNLMRMFGAGT